MGKYDGLVREIKSKFGSRLKKWDADIYADNLGIEMQDFSADDKLTKDILAFIKSKGYKIDYTSDDAFCEIKDSLKAKNALQDDTKSERKDLQTKIEANLKSINTSYYKGYDYYYDVLQSVNYVSTLLGKLIKLGNPTRDSFYDSQELKNLAYQFAKLGSELDRANSPQSRHLLEANDDKLYMELYKMGLKVKAQLEKEIPKMTNKNFLASGKQYAMGQGSDIIALLKDGSQKLYWGSEGVSRSLKSKGQELAKQIDDLIRKYGSSAVFGKDSLKKDSLKTYRINGKIIKAKNVDSAIRKYKDSLD